MPKIAIMHKIHFEKLHRLLNCMDTNHMNALIFALEDKKTMKKKLLTNLTKWQ